MEFCPEHHSLADIPELELVKQLMDDPFYRDTLLNFVCFTYPLLEAAGFRLGDSASLRRRDVRFRQPRRTLGSTPSLDARPRNGGNEPGSEHA